MEKTKEEKKGLFFRFINGVEVIGNKLPHPFYLFTILIVVAIVLSVIFAGVSVTYESASSKGTGGEIVTVTIKNLLNKETINYVTQNLYSIYYNFSPMMMMGLLMRLSDWQNRWACSVRLLRERSQVYVRHLYLPLFHLLRSMQIQPLMQVS